MTIPSRPAPPPPKPNNMRQQNYGSVNNPGTKSISRYAPTTNWDDKPFDSNAIDSAFMINNKKIPPPRPPPPKTLHQPPVLKKSATPNSVNILSNLFGAKRSKTPPNRIGLINPVNKIPPKVPPPPSYSLSNAKSNSNSTSTNVQLIDFNSPPSSPTLTQKSNSDCVSVDSFSSDSIYSPNNGNTSQTESGFEDDFNIDSLHIKNKDPWEPIDPFELPGESKKIPILPPPPSNLLQKSGGPKTHDFHDPLCNGKSLIGPTPVVAPTIIRPVGKKRENYAVLPQVTGSQLKEDIFGDTTPPSPPMPLMPPPPPPPEFFVEDCASSFTYDDTNYTDTTPGDSYGISLFDFDGIQEDDLDFRANEKIYLLRKINEEWYYGRDKRGCEGMFPINYLDVKIKLPNDTIPATSSAVPSMAVQSQTKVKVLYTFNGEVAEDLKLMENEMVEILYKINDEWLYGRVGSREGQFPANFVEYIPKNLPKMP